MDRGPNVRPKTIKLLEQSIGQKHCDIGFGSDFMDMTPEAQATQEKNRQIGLYENNFNVCTKRRYPKNQKAVHKWANILENYILIRG